MVCQFCLFSQRTRFLVLLIFAIVSFISFSIFSTLIFVISFLLLWFFFFFFLLFLVDLGVRLGCLFDVFLVSWGRLAFWWTSLSTAFTESHQFGVVLFSFVSMCILISFFISSGFPCGSAGKESASDAGDLGLIPVLVRFPGEGKGYPLQCSGLENSMDCIVHGAAKSWTQLSDFHFLSLSILISSVICSLFRNMLVSFHVFVFL